MADTEKLKLMLDQLTDASWRNGAMVMRNRAVKQLLALDMAGAAGVVLDLPIPEHEPAPEEMAAEMAS